MIRSVCLALALSASLLTGCSVAATDPGPESLTGEVVDGIVISGPPEARVIEQYDTHGALTAVMVVRGDEISVTRGDETRVFTPSESAVVEPGAAGAVRIQRNSSQCDSAMAATKFYCGPRGSNVGCRYFSSIAIMSC